MRLFLAFLLLGMLATDQANACHRGRRHRGGEQQAAMMNCQPQMQMVNYPVTYNPTTMTTVMPPVTSLPTATGPTPPTAPPAQLSPPPMKKN